MRRSAELTLELLAILAFGGVMLVTAPFSVWPGGAVGVFTDLFSKVIVVFALMLNTVTTRARFEQFVSVVVVGASYVAARTVFDYLRGINLVEGGRAGGTSAACSATRTTWRSTWSRSCRWRSSSRSVGAASAAAHRGRGHSVHRRRNHLQQEPWTARSGWSRCSWSSSIRSGGCVQGIAALVVAAAW